MTPALATAISVVAAAAVAGSLAVPTQVAPTGEDLTTGAYSQWRYWGVFTNQSADFVQLGEDGTVLPVSLLGGAARLNAVGKTSPVTFTSDANQATKLSDLSAGTLNDNTNSPWTVASTGDGIVVTFPAGIAVKNGKIVLHWQSDNGAGFAVDVVFHLTDSSAADVTKTITSTGFGVLYTEFGFSWNAATNGQGMTVSIKTNAGSGTGNVGVQVAMT